MYLDLLIRLIDLTPTAQKIYVSLLKHGTAYPRNIRKNIRKNIPKEEVFDIIKSLKINIANSHKYMRELVSKDFIEMGRWNNWDQKISHKTDTLASADGVNLL
jgi:hypothetical protein